MELQATSTALDRHKLAFGVEYHHDLRRTRILLMPLTTLIYTPTSKVVIGRDSMPWMNLP